MILTRPFRAAISVLLAVLAGAVCSAEQAPVVNTDESVRSERDDFEVPLPEDVSRLLLRNALVPGTAQAAFGQRREARLYAASLPLTAAGAALTFYTVAVRLGGIEWGFRPVGAGTAIAGYRNEPTDLDAWLLYGGTVLSLYGSLLGSYSQYAAVRDLADHGLSSGRNLRIGRPGLAALLAAPFRVRSVMHPSVLPVLAISLLQAVDLSDISTGAAFFRRDRVDFAGVSLHPVAALALRVLTALVLVWPNATWEEISYRGVSLETNGRWYSSLSFGAAHLPNLTMPGVTIEETVLQSLFATAFGFYAADIVARDGYDLRRAVAFHFWNNMIAFVASYLVSPDEPLGLTVGVSLRG